MFKVGDKVRFKSNLRKETPHNRLPNKYKPNHVYTIKYVTDKGRGYLFDSREGDPEIGSQIQLHYYWVIDTHDVDIVEETTFQVGDIVECISRYQDSDIKLGRHYTIIGLTSDSIQFRDDVDDIRTRPKDQYKLVSSNTPKVEEEPQFKVGDKVKCSPHDWALDRIDSNTIYTVIQVDENKDIWIIDKNNDRVCHNPIRFTLVSKETSQDTPKFKVGDIVRQKEDSEFYYQSKDSKGEIISIRPSGWFNIKWDTGEIDRYDTIHLELVSSNTPKVEEVINNKTNKKSIMNKLTTSFKMLTDKGTQALRKVGFINGDLELTPEGKNAIFDILLVEKKDELVKVAKEMIAEEEKSKK